MNRFFFQPEKFIAQLYFINVTLIFLSSIFCFPSFLSLPFFLITFLQSIHFFSLQIKLREFRTHQRAVPHTMGPYYVLNQRPIPPLVVEARWQNVTHSQFNAEYRITRPRTKITSSLWPLLRCHQYPPTCNHGGVAAELETLELVILQNFKRKREQILDFRPSPIEDTDIRSGFIYILIVPLLPFLAPLRLI